MCVCVRTHTLTYKHTYILILLNFGVREDCPMDSQGTNKWNTKYQTNWSRILIWGISDQVQMILLCTHYVWKTISEARAVLWSWRMLWCWEKWNERRGWSNARWIDLVTVWWMHCWKNWGTRLRTNSPGGKKPYWYSH